MPDIYAKLDPTFQAGKVADVEKLIAELADAQAKRDKAQRVIDALAAIPGRYVTALELLINQSVDGFTEKLDAQLQELLDEAEEVLASMPGVVDAESAIAEGKVSEYKRWRELHASYVALRTDHRELLLASDPAGNFAPGRPAIGYAFFLSLDTAIPDFVGALDDRGATRARLPFNVTDPADPGHWLATVRDRALLEPGVEFADEAVARAAAAGSRRTAETSFPHEPGRLAAEYGGAERAMTHSRTARSIRSTAAEPRFGEPMVVDGAIVGQRRS